MTSPLFVDRVAELIYDSLRQGDEPSWDEADEYSDLYLDATIAATGLVVEIFDLAVSRPHPPKGKTYEELEEEYDILNFAFQHYVYVNNRVFSFLNEHGAGSLEELVANHKKELEKAKNNDGL